MGCLREEKRINSPPARVWRIIEKHLQHPETSTQDHDSTLIQDVRGEALSEQRSGVGTRTRWFYEYRGKPFVWDDIVIEWDPSRRVVWKSTSTWVMEDSFTLHPSEDGSYTRLVYDMSYQLPYWLIGKLYGRLILEPRMRQHLTAVLGRMKKLSENPFDLGG